MSTQLMAVSSINAPSMSVQTMNAAIMTAKRLSAPTTQK